MITKKIHLEMALQSIPHNPDPNIELEQYSTSAKIAADILWNAYSLGDVKGLKIVDLGTGTGILAIGAALLGAREVVGVDVDQQVIEIARRETSKNCLESSTKFVSRNVIDFNEEADTVIQNPPFGAQKLHKKSADRLFMVKSLEIAPIVYSFHLRETEEFVEKFFKSHGGLITHRFYYDFPIFHIYDFHQKEKINIEVVVFRVKRCI